MNVYVISEGQYEHEEVVAVVREEDFPTYKEMKLAQMKEAMQKRIDDYTGENTVVKVLHPISDLYLEETDGTFGVRCIVLMGTKEFREVMLDDYTDYKMMPLWEK